MTPAQKTLLCVLLNCLPTNCRTQRALARTVRRVFRSFAGS